MSSRLSLSILVAACVSGPPFTERERAIMSSLGGAPCVDPASLGAIPDDGLSDRVAIQAAIDAAGVLPNGGTVCMGPGRWTLDRAPIGSYNRFAALSWHTSTPLALRGVGHETVLDLVGDQGNSTTLVVSIDPGAQHVRIADLTIDTTASMNTSEQTHAIGTSGVCSGPDTCKPIRDVEIENVLCVHPRNTPSRKGDCFRLLGNSPETEVYGVRIIGNHVKDAARAAVELQRGLHGVVIANNTFHCESCDQIIDGEATGGQWVFDTVITGNVLTSGPTAQGDFAISCTSCDGAVISGNKMDRGIALYRTKNTVLSNNAINAVATRTDDGGTIRIRNICDGNVVSGNTIKRSGAPGPLISLEAQVSACTGATVTGNTLTQETPRWAIYGDAFGRGLIGSNTITHTVPAVGFPSIYDRSTMLESPVVGLSIANNVIHGPVTYGVRLEAYPGSFGKGVSIVGNTANDTVFGLRCEYESPGAFTAPITSSGNSLGPTAYGGVVVVAGD
jgi:hypothetical protein